MSDEAAEGDTAGEASDLEVDTMLLSRVAEHLYWAGRYLERAEATARLVRTHTELFIDLPRRAGLGWAPLLAVTGTHEVFADHHEHVMEEDVASFLLSDTVHQGSVVSSLDQARANLRVTRGFLPRRSWEGLNEMSRWVRATADRGALRSGRLLWTEEVIRRCHMVMGSIAATMTRDHAYAFLEIGKLVERADMTTRVLDVQAGILMDGGDGAIGPFADLTWMSMLRSLGGEQMFRHHFGGMVTDAAAVRFMLRDAMFPRSIEHCLIEVSRWILELPHQEVPMAGCAEVQRQLESFRFDDLSSVTLHRFVDDAQIALDELHVSMAATYFLTADLATA
jgi:uncharacterized alpha-E superfamily protein